MPTSPNIIFINVDDLGWGDLKCYGNEFVKTPNLDRMAEEGILLEHFYVNAPLCSPSRAGALTGRFPGSLGIHYWMSPYHNAQYGMPDILDLETPTYPRLLQQAGYRTAHFGKWHVGEDETAPVSAYGFDEVDYIWQGVGPNPGIEPNDPRGTEMLVDRTIRFIEEVAKQDQRFMVNLWPRDVHAALDPSEASLARYKHLMSQNQFKTALQIYYAAITEMDLQIGRLLDWLDAQPGLAENTLVIFSSDNGPEDPYIPHAAHHCAGLAGPFRGRKRSLYEGGTRVPFIARWKGTIPAGGVDNRSAVSAADLLPTFCSLAVVNLPAGFEPDGEDVSDVLLQGPRAHKKPLFWEWRFDGTGQVLNRSPMLAVRDGEWKLLFNPDGSRTELYRIQAQPSELHSQHEKVPEVVARLKKMALDWQATLPAGPVTDRPGSDEYPGYPENAGRGPVMDPEKFQTLMAPVRVTITREDVEED